MKKIRMIAIAALSALAVAACTKQDPDALTMASSSLSFTSDPSSQDISFESNVQWTASADADWISVSPASGEAGTAKITVTVTKNSTYETREGKVTVKAGTKTTVFKVSQDYEKVFEAGTDIALTYAAQEFAISTNSNVDFTVGISGGEDWLTKIEDTKAAPATSVKKFKVTENKSLFSRLAIIQISSATECFEVKVSQGANCPLTFDTIEYLGNKQRIFDTENYSISTFCQWAVNLKNEDLDANVTIVFNGVKANVADLNVPAGNYEVDATGTHADKTVSIKSLDGVEKKYTTIVAGGKEIEINEAEVTVSESGTISATLIDDSGNAYSMYSTGTAPQAVDNSLGAQIQSVAYKANYNTYFANNNNEWDLTVYFSDPIASDVPYLAFLDLNIFGNADGELEPDAFPTGTFTVKTPDEKDSGYASGNTLAEPFTICPADGTIIETGSETDIYATILSGEVIISKEGDLYTFDINLKLQKWYYDENWDPVMGETFDYAHKFTEMPVIDVENNYSRPTPDSDVVLTKWGPTGGYSGMWFGNSYSLTTGGTTANSVFILGDTSMENYNYYFQAVLNTSNEWTYEKNYSSRYCQKVIPDGVYNFTATQPDTASDFLAKNAEKYASYRAIKNGYTGTYFYFDGGNITIADGTMTFNLSATSKGDEAHSIAPKTISITGSVPNSCMYFRDYSAASRQPMVAWYTEE